MAIESGDPLENVRGHLAKLEQLLNSTSALNVLPALALDEYSPWTTSALHPAALRVILNDLVLHQRRCVVEFGAGVSTLYLAKVLRQRGPFFLTSVDDNADWLQWVRTELERLNLWDERIQLVHAPMKPCSLAIGGQDWYDLEILQNALPESGVDLALVDGPFADSGEKRYARFPAVPFLASRFATDYTVFLDDCHRQGEQDIATTWTEEYRLTGQFLQEKGNLCYFYPKDAQHFNID
jgi:hypothetical protein